MQPAGTPFFSARESWLQALPGDVGGASQGPLSLVTQVRPSIASAIQSSLLNGIRRLLVGIKSVEKPFWIEVPFRFDLPGVIFTGPCQASLWITRGLVGGGAVSPAKALVQQLRDSLEQPNNRECALGQEHGLQPCAAHSDSKMVVPGNRIPQSHSS